MSRSRTQLNQQVDGLVAYDECAQSAFVLRIKKAAADTDSSQASYIGITDTGSARAVSLLTADKVANRMVVVKDESGGAATHNITISTQGTEKIDGADTKVISTNYAAVRLICDGSNWFTV